MSVSAESAWHLKQLAKVHELHSFCSMLTLLKTINNTE